MAERTFTGKSTNKPKNNTAVGSPPCKRPHREKQPAKEEEDDEEEIKDTATSNPRKIEKEDEGVDLPDIDVLQAIIQFHSRNGVYPLENSSAMRDFLSPWIRLGFGKPKQLLAKIEQVRRKFKKENANVIVEAGKEEEFELWMKIWGKKLSKW